MAFPVAYIKIGSGQGAGEGTSQDREKLTLLEALDICAHRLCPCRDQPRCSLTLPFLPFCQFIILRRREETRWILARVNTNVLLFVSNHF